MPGQAQQEQGTGDADADRGSAEHPILPPCLWGRLDQLPEPLLHVRPGHASAPTVAAASMSAASIVTKSSAVRPA